jgi:hypothetical protein
MPALFEDVEASELVDRRLDHRLHLGGFRDDTAHVDRDTAVGPDRLNGRGIGVVLKAARKRLLADVAHDDLGAFSCEGARDRASEARACAGDDGDLPVEAAPPGAGGGAG